MQIAWDQDESREAVDITWTWDVRLELPPAPTELLNGSNEAVS